MRLKRTSLIALPLVVLPACVMLPHAFAATTTPWALRINAGGGAYTDSAKHAWIADKYYVGGDVASFTAPVANTANQPIYQTERYGMSGYQIPLPAPGIYKLTLHFSEGKNTAAGARVFSATAEGQTIVSNLDLVKVIGANTAYDVSVTVRSADSTLDLGFSASVDIPMVEGIEVEAAAAPASTAPTTSPTTAATTAPTTSPTTAATTAPTTSPTTAPSPSAAPTTPPPTNPWPLVGTKALYVSPTGSDSNPGTASAPFRQVSKAASVATAGTIVHVAPGTYGYVESLNSGTSGAPITFVSDTKWGAKISAPGSIDAWVNTGDYVVIQGFEIADSEYSGIMSTASNGKFLGNHIHHMVPPDCTRGGAGIELQNYSEYNNDSIGNVVNDILSPTSGCQRIHGIYYQGPNGGRILNNLVYQTSGWGIHLYHNANHIIIANNTVFNNQQGGIVVAGSMESGDIAPGIDSGTIVNNNIVVNNGYWGISELGRVGVNYYANNLLYGNGSGGYSLAGGGVPTGTVTSDPQFVNYQPTGGGDYRLLSTSPAIDRGTTDSAPNYDMDLLARPQGSAMDIGAYEGGH